MLLYFLNEKVAIWSVSCSCYTKQIVADLARNILNFLAVFSQSAHSVWTSYMCETRRRRRWRNGCISQSILDHSTLYN